MPLRPGFDDYETVGHPGITLAAGRHELRIVMGPVDFMDFNWFELTRTD